MLRGEVHRVQARPGSEVSPLRAHPEYPRSGQGADGSLRASGRGPGAQVGLLQPRRGAGPLAPEPGQPRPLSQRGPPALPPGWPRSPKPFPAVARASLHVCAWPRCRAEAGESAAQWPGEGQSQVCTARPWGARGSKTGPRSGCWRLLPLFSEWVTSRHAAGVRGELVLGRQAGRCGVGTPHVSAQEGTGPRRPAEQRAVFRVPRDMRLWGGSLPALPALPAPSCCGQSRPSPEDPSSSWPPPPPMQLQCPPPGSPPSASRPG